MCIIADKVNNVSSTKIAVFHVGYIFPEQDVKLEPVSAQLVVYSAHVDSLTDQNAFILPVYNPSNKSENIIPLDMSKLSGFFTKVKSIFSKWFPEPDNESWDSYSMTNSIQPQLTVHKVGDYKFSIMEHKTDFDRLNQSELNVDPGAKISIDMHSDDYSFIVCQFYKKGKLDISPFGYICIPMSDSEMIVPTVHGHPIDNEGPSIKGHLLYNQDGTKNLDYGYALPKRSERYFDNDKLANRNFSLSVSSTKNLTAHDFEQIAEFDHEIYAIVKCTEQEMINQKIKINVNDLHEINTLLKSIQIDYTGRKIRMFTPKYFIPKKIEIAGKTDNRNLLINPTDYNFIRDMLVDKYTY